MRNFHLTRFWFIGLTLSLILAFIVPVSAQSTLPLNFVEAVVSTALNRPTSMAFAPDGRIFVTLQDGQVRIIENNILIPAPFLTVQVDANGERGLLGITFDPNFLANNYIYIYYTSTNPILRNRISRFTANGNVVVPGSEVVIFELDPLGAATNHNGGALHFGPDGRLYAATGENAVPSNASSLDNVLGKILRINSDGSIPADNPYYLTTTGNNRAIWAYGLRNPFTFSFHTGSTRMYINDVGAGAWEEINEGIRGANYGWPTTEGPTNNINFRSPIYAYNHNSPQFVCAITGGDFYNPAAIQFPIDYISDYFFADYCGNWIRRYDIATNTVTDFAIVNTSSIVDLDVGPDGALYYLARGGGGGVYRISYAPGQPPSVLQNPANVTVGENLPAVFSCIGTGSPPLSYQWERDGVPINGAATSDYTLNSAALTDTGARFRCIVSNNNGSAPSSEAVLTVVAGSPPTGIITLPTNLSPYSGGEVITFSGTASDNEDGILPPSAFSWIVDFHHDTHTHPFIGPGQRAGVSNGTFTIPATGETSPNVWYRLYMTVTDSSGLTHTTYHEIYPRLVNITLDTDPSGLQVLVDGQPQLAPIAFSSVVGTLRTFSAFPQAGLGSTWLFDSWANGGPASQNIVIPATDTTYSARYVFGLLPTPTPPPTPQANSTVTSLGFDPLVEIQPQTRLGGFSIVDDTLTWIVRITNRGNQAGTSISMLNIFSPELDILDASRAYQISGQRATIDIGEIDPGEVLELRIQTRVSRMPANGSLFMRVILTAFDPNRGSVQWTTEGAISVVGQLPSTGLVRQNHILLMMTLILLPIIIIELCKRFLRSSGSTI